VCQDQDPQGEKQTKHRGKRVASQNRMPIRKLFASKGKKIMKNVRKSLPNSYLPAIIMAAPFF
jgi:hypothetical protein